MDFPRIQCVSQVRKHLQVLHVEPEDLKVLNAVAEDVDDAEKPVTC